MTENKRFTHQRTDDYNFSDILDDGKWVGICHVDCEDDFVNLLNELHEENKRLKFDKSNLHHAMSKEEVRHKQFKDKIFCQIDCKIKQLKDCYMMNEAKIIEDLKEELIWND